MMNLFAGPPIFRSALISVGEARALQLPSVYSDVKSPQYAFCNTSITNLPSTSFPVHTVIDADRLGRTIHMKGTFVSLALNVLRALLACPKS